MRHWLIGMLVIIGVWQVSEGGYIQAKAWLAQVLMERAWQLTLRGEQEVKPWPWADTWPVGKLELPSGDTYIVLEGSSGRTLAFGPGWDTASSPVGQPGIAVVGAHRDTHFQGLGALDSGDLIRFQGVTGGWRQFRIQRTEIVDSTRMAISHAVTDIPMLVLVTCYPFDDWVPGGPWRYVVTAELEPAVDSALSQLTAAAHLN